MASTDPQVRPRYSVDEYMLLSAESETKLEFRDGQIIDMARATFEHNSIAANLLREIGNRLRGSPCRAVGSDQRVRAADRRYAYPDVTVVCGQPQFAGIGGPRLTITNPTVLIEVLSPSTEAADRSEKMLRYIDLAALMTYVLVAQDKPRVEVYFRNPEGSWEVGPTTDAMGGSVRLVSIDVELPMADIYAGIDLPTGQRNDLA